jgi:transposase-like protein
MGPDHLEFAPLNVLVLVLLFGLFRLVFRLALSQCRTAEQPRPKVPRPLRPKSGADCPFCRAEELARHSDNPTHEVRPRRPPQSWRSTWSRPGRKKASRTEGFACHNPACPYYGITDQTRHALVFDGAHGKHERIQDLRCQACGHKFSVRRQTVSYHVKTHSARVAEALTCLAEGVDVSVLERVWRVCESTWTT